MGAIRGVFLVLVCVLLFLSLLCVNLFWTLTLSLNYDNVQKESVVIVKDILQGANITNQIQKIYPLIQLYCQNNSNYVFSEGGYTFDIPCSTILQGEVAIIDESVKDLIHEVYYAEYNCNFLDCFKQSQVPLFLISEKSYNYWNSKFYISLIISLILSVLVFFLVEKKTNMPILVGSILIVSSLPFIKLDYLFSLFPDKILSKILRIFFSQSYFVSVRVLIAGIILLVAGIILKIFKIGFFISNVISKIKKKSEVKAKKKLIQKQIVKKIIKKPLKKTSKAKFK